jgi:organic radical activating enzyme
MKCAWIENMMSIETDGWTRPCCLETSDLAKITPIQDGIKNAFNHHRLLYLRNNLINEYSEKTRNSCGRCEQLEVNNQTSMRMSTSFISNSRELKVLQFKMSNKCQLACAHCGPDRSSTWAKVLNITPHVKVSFEITDKFVEELIELLPNITVLKFSGGEPFLDPDHWKLLDRLKHVDRSHCEIQYITNGLIKPRIDLWEGWREIKCSVSVDGFEDTYEWFRRGSSWTELLNNIQVLTEHTNLSINYAITPFTFQNYHTANEYWSKHHSFSSFPIVYPDHCNMLKFPRRIIEQISDWQSIPFATGTNSDEFLSVFRNWAIKSDTQWNTVGLSTKLFNWMNI